MEGVIDLVDSPVEPARAGAGGPSPSPVATVASAARAAGASPQVAEKVARAVVRAYSPAIPIAIETPRYRGGNIRNMMYDEATVRTLQAEAERSPEGMVEYLTPEKKHLRLPRYRQADFVERIYDAETNRAGDRIEAQLTAVFNETARKYQEALAQGGDKTIWKLIDWVPASQMSRTAKTCHSKDSKMQTATRDGKINRKLKCTSPKDYNEYDILGDRDSSFDRFPIVYRRGADSIACVRPEPTECQADKKFVKAYGIVNMIRNYYQPDSQYPDFRFIVILGGIGLLEFGTRHKINWEDSLGKPNLIQSIREMGLNNYGREDPFDIRDTYLPGLEPRNYDDVYDVILYSIIAGLQMKFKDKAFQALLQRPGVLVGEVQLEPELADELYPPVAAESARVVKARKDIMKDLRARTKTQKFTLEHLASLVAPRARAYEPYEGDRLKDAPKKIVSYYDDWGGTREPVMRPALNEQQKVELRRYDQMKDYFRKGRRGNITDIMGFRTAARGPGNRAMRSAAMQRQAELAAARDQDVAATRAAADEFREYIADVPEYYKTYGWDGYGAQADREKSRMIAERDVWLLDNGWTIRNWPEVCKNRVYRAKLPYDDYVQRSCDKGYDARGRMSLGVPLGLMPGQKGYGDDE